MSDTESFSIDKTLLRRSFDRAASTYDAAAILQAEVGRRLLERLELTTLRPRQILDLGCGTGVATQALRRRYRGANVVALDLSEQMVRRTRARCGWLRRPLPVCADLERLPLAPESVDLVYSNLAMQWSNALEPTLAGLLRSLRPGGLLMFTTFGPDTLTELREAWARVDGHTHVNRFHDMHDIGDWLMHTGFAEPVMDMERLTLTYTTVNELIQDLRLIGAQNRTQGRARSLGGRERLARLHQTYETHRRSDGRIPATYEVVYGHAWRASGQPSQAPAPPGEVQIPLEQLRRSRRR